MTSKNLASCARCELNDERVVVDQRYKASGLEVGQMRHTGAVLFHVRDGKTTKLGVNTKRDKQVRRRL